MSLGGHCGCMQRIVYMIYVGIGGIFLGIFGPAMASYCLYKVGYKDTYRLTTA